VINDRLFDSQTNKYGSGKQITYIMPFLCGIVPENLKKQVADNLMNCVAEEGSGHFGTGIYGTSFLPDILCDYGYADLAFSLFTQTTYPGFGYQILNFDATTTWEQWGIIKTEREMETYDHAMFSGADKTFYTRFGGILPLAPGYKTILIRPCIPEGLNYARSSIKTVHGLVASDWEKSGKTFNHHINIPVNTSAVICLPGNDPDKVTENGVKASKLKGIRYLRTENNYIVYEAGSGSYSFSCELP
jgi:alpha-L-rhamnosidase